jgi:regulatory protein
MVFAKAKNKSFNEIYLRASSFCAYQERSQKEVRDKLYEDGVDRDMAEEVIAKLITDNFLNEERFAKTFTGGKFRMKKWGRLKITHALQGKGVSPYCIRKGLEEIDPDNYTATLRNILSKRMAGEKEKDIFKKKSKVAGFAIRKGFEPDIVWDELNTLSEEI